MASRVRTHTRTNASGRTTTVHQHSRTGRPRRALISPGHSWKLAKRAFRASRKKKTAAAIVLGLLALTEITAWLTLEGLSLALVTAGALAVSVGVVGAMTGGVHRGSRR